MIYSEVIRADSFHSRNYLLAEDLRLQPQLAVVAPAAQETKLNNNNHGCHFGSITLLI